MTFYMIMLSYFLLRLTMKYGGAIAHRQEERAFEREYQASKMAAEEATQQFQLWRESRRQQQIDPRLKILGLERLPKDKAALRKARNEALLRWHEDFSQGSHSRSVAINEAYTDLSHAIDLAANRTAA